MKSLLLYRYDHSVNATAGLFIFDGTFLSHTLENSHTLITSGVYELRLSYSPKFTPLYGTSMLEIVEPGTDRLGNRDQCLIHPANKWDELRGCVAPGDISETRTAQNGDSIVGASKQAYGRVYAIITEAMRHTTVRIHIAEKIVPVEGI